MAYTEILLLRHLVSRPSHGYELRKRIEATTGILINTNSLYPALRRFVEAGAVEMTVEQNERRPPRNRYEITDVGREMLHDLLAELPPAQAAEEVEFVTRLGQFSFLTRAEREHILTARETAVTGFLAHFARLAGQPNNDVWSNSVIDYMRSRSEAELAWLLSLRAQV